MKQIWLILIVVMVLILPASVLAGRPDSLPSPAERTFSLPAQATEVAPGVYYLGTALDEGRVVEGYAFVYYKPGYARPSIPGKSSRDSTCYTYLARGAKWKTIEPYIIDPTNDEGLTAEFIRENIATDIEKWEAAAGKDILGNEIPGTVDGVDWEGPDEKNEVMFGEIEEGDVIAVCSVWGVFSAPVPFRELIEWDQIYDQVDFDWSSSGESGKMDFENIATHELGHSVGMGDLSSSACSEQTMYGEAGLGEIKKRDLASGDIFGIRSLYK